MTKAGDLQSRIDALGPWHHKVALADGTVTLQSADAPHLSPGIISYVPKQAFDAVVGQVFPDGLAGRSFLDCGCNAGGFCFAARAAGAGAVYGFDARQRWIDQAQFIASTIGSDTSDMRFETQTLEAFGQDDAQYDVTWFSGLLNHLPEAVASLKVVADRTREVLFLVTPCAAFDPDTPEDPGLVLIEETTDHPLSGVDGLGTLPSGPHVLKDILDWMGFVETRTYLWQQGDPAGGPDKPATRGRVGIAAARVPGLLARLPDRTAPNQEAQPARPARPTRTLPQGTVQQTHPAPGPSRPLRWEDDISTKARDTAPFDTIPPVAEWSDDQFVAIEQGRAPEDIRPLPLRDMARLDTAPLPSTADREGYCGDNHEMFWLSGLQDYVRVMQVMERYDHTVERLLDVGCASGRVLRHFAFQSEVSELWGSDINHRHVRFLSTYMPPQVRPIAVPALPHLPVEDNYFDLITAFSVFTHIDVFETGFLADIRRALKPGGLAYLTVSDEHHWEALRGGVDAPGWNLAKRIVRFDPDFPDKVKEPLGSHNRYYPHAETGPYRGTIFTPQDHLRQVWSRFFTIEEMIPQGHAQQTVVVLRK